jgi:hypothetical protein
MPETVHAPDQEPIPAANPLTPPEDDIADGAEGEVMGKVKSAKRAEEAKKPNRAKKVTLTKAALAIHEAAHAVAAWFFGGCLIDHITIDPDKTDGNAGYCRIDRFFGWEPINYAIFALAGPVAENVYLDLCLDRVMGGQDYLDAVEAIDKERLQVRRMRRAGHALKPVGKTKNRLFVHIFTAFGLVKTQWPRIEALAKELVKHKTVYGWELDGMLHGIMPLSLNDGDIDRYLDWVATLPDDIAQAVTHGPIHIAD